MGYHSRTSIYDLPNWEMPCDLTRACVYRQYGRCDQPRTNKGNSDAACHKMLNRDMLSMLNASEAASRERFLQKIAAR